MTFHDTLALLGGAKVVGRDVHSELDLAAEVVSGLPSASLDHLVAVFAAHGMPPSSVYDLVGTSRTLLQRRRHRARLSHDESDRLARLARVAVRAVEALGATDTGMRWLDTANRALEGRRPITLLVSDPGTSVVEAALGRIEHGMPS